jgi:hypothetical protein
MGPCLQVRFRLRDLQLSESDRWERHGITITGRLSREIFARRKEVPAGLDERSSSGDHEYVRPEYREHLMCRRG